MQIIKRNGQVAEFDPDKIYQAILKAAQTVYVLDDTWRQNLAQVTKKVVLDLQDAQVERPTINMIHWLKIVSWKPDLSILLNIIFHTVCNEIWSVTVMVTRSLSTYALSRLNKKSHQAMAFFVSDCHFVFFKSFIKDSSSCP